MTPISITTWLEQFCSYPGFCLTPRDVFTDDHLRPTPPHGTGAYYAVRCTHGSLAGGRLTGGGGGVESGWRSGVLPVARFRRSGHWAGGVAVRDHAKRRQVCLRMREKALSALARLSPQAYGPPRVLEAAGAPRDLALPGSGSRRP